MEAHICDICGRKFANKYALGPHKRACWNAHQRFGQVSSDFTNSDSDSSSVSEESASPVSACVTISQPVSASVGQVLPMSLDSESMSEAEESVSPGSASVTIVQSSVPLWELAQREKHWGVRTPCATHRVADYNADLTFSYIPVSLLADLIIINS